MSGNNSNPHGVWPPIPGSEAATALGMPGPQPQRVMQPPAPVAATTSGGDTPPMLNRANAPGPSNHSTRGGQFFPNANTAFGAGTSDGQSLAANLGLGSAGSIMAGHSPITGQPTGLGVSGGAAAASASPSSVYALQQTLKFKIQECIDFCIFKNAVFLAERLFAEFPCTDSLHVLASSFQKSGDVASAYRLLKQYRPFNQFAGEQQFTPAGSPDPMTPGLGSQWKCFYLFGVCCGMSDRYQECEQVMDELSRHADHSGVRYWLGVAGQHLQRRWAGKAFISAVNQNPSLFVAYEHAVQYDGEAEINPYRTLLQHAGVASSPWHMNPIPAPNTGGSLLNDGKKGIPSTAPAAAHTGAQGLGVANSNAAASKTAANTTTTAGSAPRGRNAPSAQRAGSVVGAGAPSRTAVSPLPIRQTLGPSDRDKDSVAASEGSATASSVTRTTPTEASTTPGANGEGIHVLYSLLKPYADIARLLAHHRCSDVLQNVKTWQSQNHNSLLGGQAAESSWMLTAAALAYFHNAQHQEAAQVFAQLRSQFQWRLNDPSLVVYSTALWHTKDEHALAQLSQVMVDAIPHSSISLAILGNCYSLVRETKAALTMFNRACQADPSHAYVHNLRGYECMAADQRQEAELAFNMALRYDPKLYTALAGLGTLHYSEGNDEKARHYYSQALKINQLVTIWNCMAKTYLREGSTRAMLLEALGYFEEGLKRNPNHYACRHQRAVLLLRLGSAEEAARCLEALRDETPTEAATYIELARAYSRLQKPTDAVHCLHKAMDLDSRRATYVKELLDRLASSPDQKINKVQKL